MRETLPPREVVNDTAERGVRDIQEYVNAVRDQGQRGRTILMSNSHKFKLREFQKNEMEYNRFK